MHGNVAVKFSSLLHGANFQLIKDSAQGLTNSKNSGDRGEGPGGPAPLILGEKRRND